VVDPGSRYFAYGSNMDTDQMAFRGLEVLRTRAAVLRDFRLDFTYDGGDRWLGGAADVVREEGAVVEGVLYDLGNSIELMDPWEGAPDGYRRFPVDVEVPSTDGTVSAWTYEVVDKLPYLPPSEGYIGKMILAARKAGLSQAYIGSLRLHMATSNQDLIGHIAVLRALAGAEGPASLDELAETSGLGQLATQLVLEDLMGWGWVAPANRVDSFMVPTARTRALSRMLR
jgi:hypothetical protein